MPYRYLVLITLFCTAIASENDNGSLAAHSFVSWTSNKLEVRSTASGAYGMFAKESIGKDEPVAVFGGTIINKQQVLHLAQNAIPNVLQLSDHLWSTSGSDTHEPIDHINHSCKPNAGMRGQILLVAMRDIEANEEVTFDYGMVVSEWVGMEPIICTCGAAECRKTILADDWKNKRLQQVYKGYFAQHVQDKIELLESKGKQ